MSGFLESHDDNWLLLVGLALFPRITMLFVGGPFGWLAWTGWFLAPHVTVAIIATMRYGDTDPVLVAIAWVFALLGSSSEAKATKRGAR